MVQASDIIICMTVQLEMFDIPYQVHFMKHSNSTVSNMHTQA